MTYSLRTAAYLKEQARLKNEERQRREAEADAQRAEFKRKFWDREKTAAALGISVNALRRWITARKGPLPVKIGGQRTFWRAADVRAYRDNPAAFESRKNAAANG